MTRALAALSTAALLFSAGSSLAQTASRQGVASTQRISATRVLYVCDRSADTRAAFEREHGAMRFMTAQELTRSARLGETWGAPRCISEGELMRFRTLQSRPLVTASR